MTQNVFPDINPDTTDGNELATLLNDFRDSYLTANSGTARPSYVQEGTIWLNDSDRNNALLQVYTTGGDTTLFTIDLDTGTVSTSTDTFPTWSAGATFGLNDVVWHNNAQYRSTTNNNTGNDPEVDTGAAWKPVFINADQTLAVPSRFATPQDAYIYLDEAVISGTAFVTIEVTGVVNISSPIFPQVALIPARVILKGASTVSMPSGDWYLPGTDAANIFQPSSWETARDNYWAPNPATARDSRVTIIQGNLSGHFPNRIRMTSANVPCVAAFAQNDFGEIRDLCLEGPVNQTGLSGEGISLENGASMRLNRALIFGFANAGIKLSDYAGIDCIDVDVCATEGAGASNVLLERTSAASFVTSAEDTGSRITHAEGDNIKARAGSVGQLVDLQCWGAEEDGVVLEGSSDVTLDEVNNSTIQTVVSFNREYGVRIGEGCSNNCVGVTVKANGNATNDNSGVFLTGGNLSFTAGQSLGNAGSGVLGQGCDIYTAGTIFWSNGSSGIEISGGNLYSEGSDMQTNVLAGLGLTSAIATILGGQIKSSTDGVAISATTSKVKVGSLLFPVNLNSLDIVAYMSGIDARQATNIGATSPTINTGPDPIHGGVITGP